MESFKNKLRNLLNNSKYTIDGMNENDPDRKFTKLIYKEERKLRNSSRNNYNKNTNKNNLNNYLFKEYNINKEKPKKIYEYMSRNKSQNNNINKKFFNSLFSVNKISNEKTINNINTLMRTFTIKDIHNSFDNLNLSKSYSNLDINETKRSKNGFKKKISYMKKIIEIEKENKQKIINNIIQRQLNNSLCKYNKREYYAISPTIRLNNNNNQKKNFINFQHENSFIKYKIKENLKKKSNHNRNHFRANSDFNNSIRNKSNVFYIKVPL